MNALPSITALPGALPPLAPPSLPAGAAIPAAELRSAGVPVSAPAGCPGDSFGQVLNQLVNEVNAKQAASQEIVGALMSGQNVPLHQAMLAMEEASLSFQLMVEVRNRLLESYQELMRMQI